MPNRILEDWDMFRKVIDGTLRKELQKRVHNGQILHQKGKDVVRIPVPTLDLPKFRYGKKGTGVGSGPGKEGDVVGHDDGKGKGKGKGKGQPGTEPGEFIEVDVPLDEVLRMMGEDWELPNMKPKDSATFEEIKIVYNSLSPVGPPALLHRKKTLCRAMRRMMATGELDPSMARMLPGYSQPIVPITPIRDDMRYRQWNERRIPCSKAVIFFARDISGSMDQLRCDIVSEMSWWIDMWIRKSYDHTERCYVLHDTRAHEVDEQRFYKARYGGGTTCSVAMQHIAKQLKHRFPPHQWNVYVFYFGDGENGDYDNAIFADIIKKKLNPGIVNLVGISEILPYNTEWGGGLKKYIDGRLKGGKLNNQYVRTTSINWPQGGNDQPWWMERELGDEHRGMEMKKGIKDLLGKHAQFPVGAAG